MQKINFRRLESLFAEMVNIYSPSGKEEDITALLYERLHSMLAPHNCEVRLQYVDDTRANILVDTPAREKVAAPRGDARAMLLLGHIDTVPAYDIENYQLSERGGHLYGLGTSDMKSGCAAMIEGLVTAAEQGALPEQTMLALVVGEEETGDGTAALLQKYRFQSALVAEPTGMQPCTQHYGYIEMLVRTFGYRRHAATASRDTNAIRALLRLLLEIEDYAETREPAVLNIRDLHSSESGFAVPDRCSAAVDLHVPPGISAAGYARQLQGFAEEVLQRSRCTSFEIEFPTLADGYSLPESTPLSAGLHSIFDAAGLHWKPTAFASHSDANLLHDAGCSPVILGPGTLAKAHTRDESVEKQQLELAAGVFAELMVQLAHGERTASQAE